MKARTICLALWLLLLTRVVGAQIPQIEYRVGKDGTIRSVFTATTKPSCFLKPYGDEERPLEFAEDGEGTWSAMGSNEYLLQAKLGADPLPNIFCRPSGPESEPARAHPTVVLDEIIQIPLRVDPMSGVKLPTWFLDSLGKLKSCTMSGQQCTLEGGVIKASRSVESGTFEAIFVGRRTTKITAKVETCQYTLTSPGGVVLGAQLASVSFDADPPASDCYVFSSDREIRLTRAGAPDVPVRPRGSAFSLRLPPDVPTGIVKFDMLVGDQKRGVVTAHVVQGLGRKSEELRVTYADSALDRLQNPTSTKGVAIALPEGTAKLNQAMAGPVIRNAARIELPAELGALSEEIATNAPIWSPRPMLWQIVGSSWGTDVQFSCTDETKKGSSTTEFRAIIDNARPCRIRDPATIEFAVLRRKLEPLEVRVQLRRVPADVDQKREPELVLETNLTLANSAEVESIPFPAARFLTVQCDNTSVRAGQSRAIGHNDLQEKLCYAQIDVVEAKKAIPSMAVYGPQTLMVSVTPKGGASTLARWDLALDKSNVDPFPLPTPETQAAGGEYYDVEITVAAKDAAQVIYRAGTTQLAEVGEARDVRRGELVYQARLRSRGVYGIRGKIRTFVTVPVEVAAIRFPARGDELADSSSSPNYQFMSPVVGVLLGMEPWNYDTGRNLWAIPMRALGGIHVREVRNHPELSVVLGGAVTLPIIDAPSELGSSLAVGGYASLDLAPSGRAFANRLAFVATLGFNVLSLFAGR